MAKQKKPDIYPPEFPDPLAPGGIPAQPDPEGVAKDAYLGDLARDVEAGEAEPGEPLPEDEVAALSPEDVADLGTMPAPEFPGDATEPPLLYEGDPTGRLKQITLGQLNPTLPIAGAKISFDPRCGKHRDAIAQLVSYVTDQGVVFVDLTWGNGNEVTNVPYGDGPRTWKFRAE